MQALQTRPFANKKAQGTALVVIDPQVDVMSSESRAWTAVRESVAENNFVPNLVELFTAAKKAGVVVAVSPHHYYHWDHEWHWQAPLEKFQHDARPKARGARPKYSRAGIEMRLKRRFQVD